MTNNVTPFPRRSVFQQIDWTAVTHFFNGTIENPSEGLVVEIYSPSLDQTLTVELPAEKVEAFMKTLPLVKASITNSSED